MSWLHKSSDLFDSFPTPLLRTLQQENAFKHKEGNSLTGVLDSGFTSHYAVQIRCIYTVFGRGIR